MNGVFPAAACAALLAASGVAHAVLTGRWQPPPSFAGPQERLDALPAALGPWTARPVPIEADDLARVGIRATLSRQYRHQTSGQAVTVLVVGGRPGPIAVHTPDVCFQGNGYQQQGAAATVPLGGGKLWAATFNKPTTAAPGRLLVAWGWDAGDGWAAPDHRVARVQFARSPALYKVYLVTDAKAAAPPDELLADLAGRLLPAVRTALFPPA